MHRANQPTSVSADDAARIVPGDRASITLPEGEVQTTVRSITPGVDVESRSATVLLSVSGTGGLRPGQGTLRTRPRGRSRGVRNPLDR